MAIVRNAANMIRRGRVGETTYYVSGGQQIARQSRNDSNFGESARRSEAQQSRRVLWANLVNFYKVSQRWMPKAFETKKRNQSDYNKFMSVNIGSAAVALTKAEAAAGACIAAGYIVSQGSLPSIEVTATQTGWMTNLKLGSLNIAASTTVAQFSQALVDNNGNCRIGQQLSFVSYQQSVDALGTPRLICRCYEVTLSESNSEPIRNYLPEFCSQTVSEYLGTSNDISIGGFAYIISELANNSLRVSTQQLVLNNSALILKYTSKLQLSLAIASYGIDNEVILSPVSTVAQDAEAQPVYIQSVTIGDKTYRAGDYVGVSSSIAGKSVSIDLSSAKMEGVTSIVFFNSQNNKYVANNPTLVGSVITATVQSAITGTSPIVSIAVTFSNDVVVTMPFAAAEPTMGDLG